MHGDEWTGPAIPVTRWLAGMLLAGVAGLSLGCATRIDPQAAAASVPYRLDDGGRIVVDVMLNGRGPFLFLLDTGASISGISESLRRRLALAPEPGDVMIHGMTTSARLPVARVGRVELGAVNWEAVRVAVLPDDHSAADEDSPRAPVGILGSDLLRDYAVGFSTDDRVLRLFRPESVSASRYIGWRSIALHVGTPRTPAGSMLFFDIAIEGRNSRAVFDLGAGFNVVNWAAAEELGLTRERYAQLREHDLKGVFQPMLRAPRFVAGRTQTGDVRWQDEIYLVADLQIFTTLAIGDRPAAIIGAGLFAQRDFLIDFRAPRILVNIAENERAPVLH